MWQLEFELPRAAATAFQDALAEIFETMLIFESEDKSAWVVKLIFEQEPEAHIYEQIKILAGEFDQPAPEIKTIELPQIDWLAENRKDFPAMTIAPFYIHGSHLPASNDGQLIPIQVDASLALEQVSMLHRGCLEMIAKIGQPDAGARYWI